MPFINRPKKKYQRNNTEKRKERQTIYNTPEWRKLRLAYLMEHPLCEQCLKLGKTTPATQIHHIISFMSEQDEWKRKNLAYDYNNLMSLCVDCHEKMHGNIKKKR